MVNILIGTPDLAFMRRSLPHLHDSATRILEDPQKVIGVALGKIYAMLGQGYDFILTALDYTPGGAEGFQVLEELWNHPARKILWTERVTDAEVRARARILHADVLGKEEIGSFAGIVYSNCPLKTGGRVFVYVHRQESIPTVTGLVRDVLGQQRLSAVEVVVRSDLKRELMTGRYGLVIDTTAMGYEPQFAHSANGSVAHAMSLIKLPCIPRIVCPTDPSTFGQDVVVLVDRFLQLA